jgi:hypothetical protein
MRNGRDSSVVCVVGSVWRTPPRHPRLQRSHFLLDPLNRTSPEPKRLGDPQDTNTLLELLLRLALQGYVDLGPTKPGVALRRRNDYQSPNWLSGAEDELSQPRFR